MKAMAGIGVLLCVAALAGGQQPVSRKGVALAELAWPDAEPWLTASSVVVIPLGAGALEQGPHMKLDSDERLARYLTGRVMQASAVVVAPPLNYHFYPAYDDYPGSAAIGDVSARDLTVDAVRGLARTGPRRFYVLNTSPSTLPPLAAAARTLADSGILLTYTDPASSLKQSNVLKQTPIDTPHADEAATSMMLFVDASAVDMTKAKREYPARGERSTSGTFGDATLASPAKGAALIDALVAGMLADIETLRNAPLPQARPAAPPPAPAPAPAPRPAARPESLRPHACSPPDDRAIRAVGDRFTYLWTQQDALELSLLFAPNGDIRHPDGTIERGRDTILANRTQLFSRREYRGSRHPLQLNDMRCFGSTLALADGKWELRLQQTPQTSPGRGLAVTPHNSGWCTLVLLKSEDDWLIEAWRYTIDPPAGADQPVLLAKPGYIGRGGG